MIALTFALPDESRDLLARLEGRAAAALPSQPAHLPMVSGRFAGTGITVAHTGVGAAPACRARVAEVLARARPAMLIASGYAGALDPALQVGDLVLGENVSDPALMPAARAALAADGVRVGTLLTHPRTVETAADKAALRAATGALAVDMETGWIAEACRAAGVPLLALRVISDDAHTDFPVPAGILFDPAGSVRASWPCRSGCWRIPAASRRLPALCAASLRRAGG